MKKLMLSILAVAFSASVFSQGIDLGVKVGANFSTINDAVNVKNKTGLLFGAFAGVKFTSKLGIQSELLYSQQGAEFEGLGDVNLNYVNLPVFAKIYLVKGLNIQAGPQFGFVVDDNVSKVFKEINSSIKAKDFDVSGLIGLGYDLPVGVRIDARYNFGLTETIDGGDGKNGVFSLALGYSFL